MKLLLRLAKIYTNKESKKLELSLASPMEAQRTTLKNILKNTRYDFEQFQSLPIRTYEEFDDVKDLTLSKPRFFETTSGSSGIKKEIPYTFELIKDFTAMFKLWVNDVLTFGPKLKGGQIYFSISPQFTDEANANDDSDYLTGLTSLLFNQFILIPNKVKKIKDPLIYKKVIVMYLISAKNLEVVSIWSPSFFLTLLDTILENSGELKSHLIHRQFDWEGIKHSFPETSNSKLDLLDQSNIDLELLFPELKLVSSWGALNSEHDFQRLKHLLPHSFVQEKGLLATEAPMTIPSIKFKTFLPMINQVYFEFLDSKGTLFKIHELELNQIYEIIISQASGLLRYRIGDLVKVTDISNKTPCFRFVGRSGSVSDLVGEKINEQFIMEQLKGHNIPQCIFIPSSSLKKYYCISEFEIDEKLISSILQKNPHYLNAIKLEQLHPLQSVKVNNLNQHLKDFFVTNRKINLGDIKDQILYYKETDNLLLDFLLSNEVTH